MRTALVAATLLVTGCGDAGRAPRVAESGASHALRVTEVSPVDAGPGRLRIETLAATPARDEAKREGGRVAAAARQILADLGLDGATPASAGGAREAAQDQDLERMRRHVAAAWHVDVDPAPARLLLVRLRVAIAGDGTVRAIEVIDSDGGPEDLLARFVEEAIAALDWSSPLPTGEPAAAIRVLVFSFEARRAR